MKITTGLALTAALAASVSAFAQKPSPAPMKKGDKMAMSGKMGMGKVKMHKACAHCAKAGKKMCSCPVEGKSKMSGGKMSGDKMGAGKMSGGKM